MGSTSGEASAAVDRCSIHHWYPRLRAKSIRTTLINLDAAVVRYLTADGVYVPDICDGDADASGRDADDSEHWDEDDDADSGDGSGREAAHDNERFPALESAITAAIEKHGGACFPKLNWSAPTDAAWVLGGSLKCTSARDVLLLLKSSDRIAHDLCEARTAYGALEASDSGTHANNRVSEAEADAFSWTLALRRWCNLRPSSEFRCFCSSHGANLLAVSQRDRFSHYAFLEAMCPRLLELLSAFAARTFGGAHELLPPRVVWDAYVDAEERVYLLDVSPFHPATDPLMYEWDELSRLADDADERLAAARAGPTTDGVRLTLRISEAAGERATGGRPTVRAELHIADRATPPSASPSPPELRLVPAHGVAPSAQMHYGWPQDLREVGASDVGALLEAARAASKAA